MKMRKIGWLIFCVALTVMLCSCSGERVMPSKAVSEALAGCALPSGTVYVLGEGEQGVVLTEELLGRLFGDCEEGFGGVSSGALYLSARESICEAAVFYCYAASETREVAELCHARGELLARYESSVSAAVVVKGRYVLFAASEEPEPILAALSRAIK